MVEVDVRHFDHLRAHHVRCQARHPPALPKGLSTSERDIHRIAHCSVGKSGDSRGWDICRGLSVLADPEGLVSFVAGNVRQSEGTPDLKLHLQYRQRFRHPLPSDRQRLDPQDKS